MNPQAVEPVTRPASEARPDARRRSHIADHLPEYAAEALGLGIFMLSACGFAVLLFHPHSPVVAALPSLMLRSVAMGLAMGLTAVLNVYSPWGIDIEHRSQTHRESHRDASEHQTRQRGDDRRMGMKEQDRESTRRQHEDSEAQRLGRILWQVIGDMRAPASIGPGFRGRTGDGLDGLRVHRAFPAGEVRRLGVATGIWSTTRSRRSNSPMDQA